MAWPGLREYQKLRICTLLDPMRDPLGAGFHTLQSITAVGSGGSLVRGGYRNADQLAFIPERSTDFVFSGYAEEFGFFGSLLLYCFMQESRLGVCGYPSELQQILPDY